MTTLEPFVIKHYTSDERPTLKGNGFDGLEIGSTREEAEEFVAFVNRAIKKNASESSQRVAHAGVKKALGRWRDSILEY